MSEYTGSEIRPFTCSAYSSIRNNYENTTLREELVETVIYNELPPTYFLSYTAIQRLLGDSTIQTPSEPKIKGVVFYHGKDEHGNLYLYAAPCDKISQPEYPPQTPPENERIYRNNFPAKVPLSEFVASHNNYLLNHQGNLKILTDTFSFTSYQLRQMIYIDGGNSTEVDFQMVIAPDGEANFFSIASQHNENCQLSFNCPPECYD